MDPRANGEKFHAAMVDAKVSILVVDDRPDKLLATEAILAPLKQNIVTATSGKAALRQLLRQEFAVILLDVAMPGMDGFETAAMIRSRPKSEHVPIIFVTSMSGSENNMFQGYSLGAVDYIVAPIVPEVLRTKVSVFVELHKQTALVQKQAEELRRIEEEKHRRMLAEAADKIEAETRRNRFFTLALDLLGIADFDGHLIQVNPAWERVLGYTEAELKSRSVFDLVHHDDQETMLAQFHSLRAGRDAIYFENRYQHKFGGYRWLGWTAAPFAAERLIYIFARDVTARKASEGEIKSLNTELKSRVNELTEINSELEGFSYSISHDLRAPLRSISSFAQLIREDHAKNLDRDGLGYLGRVEQAAKYMDNLLVGLLDYSRLGRSELDLLPINLDSAVRDILVSIEDELKSRQADVRTQGPLGSVMGHPVTVRQVLYNLIANGIKFVSPGSRAEIQIWSEPQKGNLRVWVADRGIGIPPQFHKKVFGLFQRLHPQAYPGTGVGLAMVRKGIERMGGRIGLESEPNCGSRFWFELTAAPQPAAEPVRQLQTSEALS